MDKLDLKKMEDDGQFLIKTGKNLEQKLNMAIRSYEKRLEQCAMIEACENQLKTLDGGMNKSSSGSIIRRK